MADVSDALDTGLRLSAATVHYSVMNERADEERPVLPWRRGESSLSLALGRRARSWRLDHAWHIMRRHLRRKPQASSLARQVLTRPGMRPSFRAYLALATTLTLPCFAALPACGSSPTGNSPADAATDEATSSSSGAESA